MAHAHRHDEEEHGTPLSPDPGHLHAETRKPMKREMKRLRWAIGITGLVMLVEIAGGLMANSLALLSDAGHMFTHVFALGMSYFAIVIASRPANMEKTFGYFRAEVLAAFVNGLCLLGITGLIFYEAASRLVRPEEIGATEMLLVAVVGLVANGASLALLMRVSGRDLNLRSAFMHVVYDTASSVAVVGCAVFIKATGFLQIDPIVSAGIGVMILIWCIDLLKESVNILLEATPKGVSLSRIKDEVESIPHVRSMHDIHAWQITTDMYVMTAHVALDEMPISEAQRTMGRINHLLRQHHKIGHTTLQLESAQVLDADGEPLHDR